MSLDPNPKPTVIMSFDIGLKRTGVAVGQSLSETAQIAGLIEGSGGQMDWSKLQKLLARWQPDVIVVGDPATNDPHLLKLINRFKSHIQQNYKTKIVEISEELTSAAASSALQDSNINTKQKIEIRDQIAACLILESYFNSVG